MTHLFCFACLMAAHVISKYTFIPEMNLGIACFYTGQALATHFIFFRRKHEL